MARNWSHDEPVSWVQMYDKRQSMYNPLSKHCKHDGKIIVSHAPER